MRFSDEEDFPELIPLCPIDPPPAHLAVLWVAVHIPAAGSLKSKRHVLKSIKERIRARFNVCVAEVSEQDKWQRSVLATAIVNENKRYLDGELSKIMNLMQSAPGLEVTGWRVEYR